MVSIEIDKKDLLNLIGRELTDEQIEETLFLLKVESKFSENKIECELNPDRPDMFSVEGIARSMKGFLEIETGIAKYKIIDSPVRVKIEDVKLRPALSIAIIRNVVLSDELVRSLMQLQEKLNDSIGRGRRKTDIGVFDLDKTKPPYIYTFMKPEDIRFVPLGFEEEMDANEILEKHPKGIKYGHIIKEFDKYPVIIDKDKKFLGLIPIINADENKVTKDTKNLLIDVIGIDQKYVDYVMNILVCNIAERSGEISTVNVRGKKTPNLKPREITMEVSNIDGLLGLGLSESEIVKILERMRYNVRKMKAGKIGVSIPPYRADILHEIDIVEDVAIGYGYNNIQPILPKIATIGGLSELEKISTKTRELMIGLEFQETLNFILTSKENNFSKMKIEGECVEILNPVSSEYNICRTWILPSLIKVLSSNKHREYPQRIFEIGDCVTLDEETETGTKTIRKLAAVISYDNANLTEMKSIVETVLKGFDYKYIIKDYGHPSFIESRCGEILVNEKQIGFFGELHPEILEKWGLEKPVIGFEIKVD